MKFFVLILLSAVMVLADVPCAQRNTDIGAVCVCNSTYCDTVPTLASLTSGQYQLYSTSKSKMGFASTTGTFSNSTASSDGTVTVSNLSSTHQTIFGFGGAFTDSTGINILRLSPAAQELLMQTYFGEDGVQYSVGRIPIGGTDYSLYGYTYVDVEDETLDSFALQEGDLVYKIPFIQRAIELRGGNLKFFSSAWSAPIWMKTSDSYNGFGRIQDQYYDVWARYYIKFFDAYDEHNITFWGVTTQNEPFDGLIGTDVPNNGFTNSEMISWIKVLGATIRNSTYSDIKIIAHDDQRPFLPNLKWFILSDTEALQYVDGIGVHWYIDFITPAFFLDFASSDSKELFRLATEACSGSTHTLTFESAVELGSWARGDNYLNNIYQDLEHDFIGWMDWNMALNETGGPNWINNDVDSPIIVNGTADEFYKQPMYYALGHFSKLAVTGSVRVDSDTSGSDISSLAFVRPDGRLAVFVRNKSGSSKTVKVDILGATEILTVDANSINTLLYVA